MAGNSQIHATKVLQNNMKKNEVRHGNLVIYDGHQTWVIYSKKRPQKFIINKQITTFVF